MALLIFPVLPIKSHLRLLLLMVEFDLMFHSLLRLLRFELCLPNLKVVGV